MLRYDETAVRRTLALLHPARCRQRYAISVYRQGMDVFKQYVTNANEVIDILNKLDDVDGDVSTSITVNNYDGDNVAGYKCLQVAVESVSAADRRGVVNASECSEVCNVGSKIYNYLRGLGFPEPIRGLSGAGYYLIYPCRLSASDSHRKAMGAALDAVAVLYTTDNVMINTAKSTPDATCPLFGCEERRGGERVRTYAVYQGTNREAKISEMSKANLLRLVDVAQPRPISPAEYNGYHPDSFDLGRWLDSRGIRYDKTRLLGYSRYRLTDGCIFDVTHGDAMLYVDDAHNAIGYHCDDLRCDATWADVHQHLQPDSLDLRRAWLREQRYDKHARDDDTIPRKIVKPTGEELSKIDKEKLYGPEDLRTDILGNPDYEEPHIYIRTGIKSLDDAFGGGLEKGQISIVTGETGSGKSTVTTGIILDAINQGMVVIHYSGELPKGNTWGWIAKQAAGANNLVPGLADGDWEVPQVVNDQIRKWVYEYYHLYNNGYGHKFDLIYDYLVRMIVDHRADLVVIDNLMSVDLSDLTDKELRAQTLFVQKLKWLAQVYKCHIMVVAHPRKDVSGQRKTLRTDDVAGSSNIVNYADYAIAVYRVTEDFKKRLNPKDNAEAAPAKHPACKGDNAIQIIKSRYRGVDNPWIPLWYDARSKRIKSSEVEEKHYDWETKEAYETIATAEDRRFIPMDNLPKTAYMQEGNWSSGKNAPVDKAWPTNVPDVWVVYGDGKAAQEYYTTDGRHLTWSAAADLRRQLYMRRPQYVGGVDPQYIPEGYDEELPFADDEYTPPTTPGRSKADKKAPTPHQMYFDAQPDGRRLR